MGKTGRRGKGRWGKAAEGRRGGTLFKLFYHNNRVQKDLCLVYYTLLLQSRRLKCIFQTGYVKNYVSSFLYPVVDTFQAVLPHEQGIERYVSSFLYPVVDTFQAVLPYEQGIEWYIVLFSTGMCSVFYTLFSIHFKLFYHKNRVQKYICPIFYTLLLRSRRLKLNIAS